MKSGIIELHSVRYVYEYYDEDDKMVQPIRFCRIVNDSTIYLVDGSGIIWTYERTLDGVATFVRFCLRSCIAYILYHDPIANIELPSEYLPSIGVEDERVALGNYDDDWRRYWENRFA